MRVGGCIHITKDQDVLAVVSSKSLDEVGFGFFVSKIFRASVTVAKARSASQIDPIRTSASKTDLCLIILWACAFALMISCYFGSCLLLFRTSFIITTSSKIRGLVSVFVNILVATSKALTIATSAPKGQPQTCLIRHIVVVCTHMKSLTS